MMRGDIVTYLEFGAALLMAEDYFIRNPLRGRLNALARNHIGKYQRRVDWGIGLCIGSMKKHLLRFAIGVTMFIAISMMFIFFCRIHDEYLFPLLNIAPKVLLSILSFVFVMFISLLLAVGAFVAKAGQALIEQAAGLSIGMVLRAFTTFLLYSPKGPISTVGMMLLITSFFWKF